MMRLLLCCSLSVCAALASPVPRPKAPAPFRPPEWGKPIDPDKDCKFTFERDSLTIEVPAKEHYLDWEGKWTNAPRLFRTAAGDFRVEVRVRGLAVDASAGLILLPEGQKWGGVRMEFGSDSQRSSNRVKDRLTFWNEEATGISDSTARDRSARPKLTTAYLRIERRDGRCHGYSSENGGNWEEQANPHIKAFLKQVKLQVGVFATSRAKAAFKVTFDQFKLTPLKAK